MIDGLIWLAMLVLLGLAIRSVRHRRPRVGSASAGTIYDWLNEDKRKAVTIVVEGRAEQRDPEHADDTVDDPDGAAPERDETLSDRR